MLNVGLGADTQPDRDRRRPSATRRSSRRSARHPTSADEFDDELEAEIRRLAEHEKVRAIGETGIDHYRETATRAEQRRAFEAQIEIARERGLPIVIHARDKDGETSATDEVFEILDARADGVAVILHCFLAPWRVRRRDRARLVLLVLRDRHLPEVRRAARGRGEAARPSCSWSRPTPPTWRRSRCGASRTSRPTSSPRRGQSPRCAAKPTSSSSGPSRPTRARSSAGETGADGAAIVRLGQNFLADPNLLDAIVRDAGLEPGDVVLEVGPGEGVLTERLAEAAGRVHAIEIDRGLEPALAAVAARPNVDLHWGDAMKLDLASLEPAPTTIVANLPYSVATPLILRTIEELPAVGSWTVMVQREIADRLRAAPGSRTYGSPSVLAQLACEVRLVRTVDPAVFRPRPRIESAILGLRRTGPAADPATRDLVRAAFAHRRKSLARSLEHGRPGVLAAARAALDELGLPEDARAEALVA